LPKDRHDPSKRWLAVFDRTITAVSAGALILVLPVSLLLFLQWPLRDLVQAYSREANDLAQWLLAIASTLGIVIPPSLVLILLSDAMLRAHSEAVNVTHSAIRVINTQDVFRAALVPAAVLLLLCVLVTLRTGTRPHTRAAIVDVAPTASDWATAAATLLLVVLLLGAVTLGYLYAVEAAATGGVVLVVFALARRTLNRSVLKDVLSDTLAVTGALFALLVGASVFTLVLRAFETDRWVTTLLASTVEGGIYWPLLSVMLVLGLCAFVLDAFEMIFVVIPVLIPPLLMRVPDAVWVAVLILLILQTSFLIPPFGYAVLMLRNQLGRPIDSLRFFRALLPYLLAQLAVLALVLAFPGVLWRDSATVAAPAVPPIGALGRSAERSDQIEGTLANRTSPANGQPGSRCSMHRGRESAPCAAHLGPIL
jgi:TRAP-type mannitol/chloroaromatic compound transport system permease large subunit